MERNISIFIYLSTALILTACSYTETNYQKIKFNNLEFDVVRVTKLSNLELFLNNSNQQVYGSFDHIQQGLKPCEELAFAMNAGMYHPNYQAVGLHIENGQVIQSLNQSQGVGNFYIQPNGVLAWNDDRATILATQDFTDSKFKAKFATQSGPLLVQHGKINSQFQKNSTSLKIRNGVGVKNQTLYFVMSREPTSFYDFAQVFRTQLGVGDALYLDGTISSIYLPEIKRNDHHFKLGPIVALIGQEKCKF